MYSCRPARFFPGAANPPNGSRPPAVYKSLTQLEQT